MRIIAELFAFVFLIALFNFHTALVPQPARLYSSSIPFRLQTNALLKGQLTLSPRPSGISFDYDYTEQGMQQNWSLGVPFLRLPFEWVAKTIGIGFFPDRITLFFYLTLMIIMLNATLKTFLGVAGLSPLCWSNFFIRWGLVGGLLFSPPIHGLVQQHFLVYDEAIFYGFIVCGILWSLFLQYLKNPSDSKLLILCALSGFVWLVRPTLVFYGLVTVILSLADVYIRTKRLRLLFLGLMLFFLGICINLGLNQLRFGSMMEFGYSANVNFPANEFQQRFDNPYRHETILNASRELFNWLFFGHHYEALRFYRWREEEHDVFNPSFLSILLIGWTSYLFLWRKVEKSLNRIILFSLLWGLASFIFLSIFYLYSPGMASRYMADFMMAYYSMFLSFILFGIRWQMVMQTNQAHKASWVVFLIGLAFLFYLNDSPSFKYQPCRYDVQEIGPVLRRIAIFDKRILNDQAFPASVDCQDSNGKNDVFVQFSGWKKQGDCSVTDLTSLFMPSQQCLTIDYTFKSDWDGLDVRVKRGLVPLVRVDSKIENDYRWNFDAKEITQRFCADHFYPDKTALYSIGWIKPEKIKANFETLPVRLNWVRVNQEN